MRLDGKVALITGGASGIGEASAIAFAAAGASVMIADRDEDRGRAVAEIIAAAGRDSDFVALDVADEASVKAMVRATCERFGRLDCAVNSAGIANQPCALTDIAVALWEQIWRVDLLGVGLCLKHQIAAMIDDGGAIVNIASDAGLFGAAMMAPYVAAKFGVVGITKTAALEYAASGIRVNAVCPGLIDTPMSRNSVSEGFDWSLVVNNPMKRLGEASEVADAALWLCSNRSSFVTGQAISVDGGLYAG